MEAILPLGVLDSSLHIQLDEEMIEDQRQEVLLLQLYLPNEKRMKATKHAQVYQKRITRAYDKHVKERKFKVGDFVLKRIAPSQLPHPQGKLRPNWEGPYIIKEVYLGNAYRLVNAKGEDLPNPWNAMYQKRYTV